MKINDKQIFFRGHNNTMAHLNWIMKRHPPQALDTFMLYGYSAGGLAVFTWIETIKSMILA